MEVLFLQNGISKRICVRKSFPTRNGKWRTFTHEHYLRNDIPCGLNSCHACAHLPSKLPKTLGAKANTGSNSKFTANHAVLLDEQAVSRFHDMLDHEAFSNVVVCQSVYAHAQKKHINAYKKLKSVIYEDRNANFFVFLNDVCEQTGFKDELLVTSAQYLAEHWAGRLTPLIVCGERDEAARVRKLYPHTLSMAEYVDGLQHSARQELLDKLAAFEQHDTTQTLYEEYLSFEEISNGLLMGTIKKGSFHVSRENYKEATVAIEGGTQWFLQGVNCNRAVQGDTVAVQLLPREEWTVPENLLRLRDLEEIEKEENLDDDCDEPSRADECHEPPKKKSRSDVLPTAKVVGIIKRNWRNYCGILMPSDRVNARRHLFCPVERLIPRIRIETHQAKQLAGQHILVAIDAWPRGSKYPLGHYVRSIGAIGDKEVEIKVLLLEHDIPSEEFSPAVIQCLPKEGLSWQPDLQPPRVDLRHLTICSVDPVGCTDIDDALHCKQLADNLYEVGVHIADVSHFVRPGTAMDAEAAHRSTSVYLQDRRIDMLPTLLSSGLCSLHGGEQRYTFSVIWTLDEEANVRSTKFHKSLIKSRAALTYERAQEMIDDSSMTDEVTLGLRGLMVLSKKLKEKRHAAGALTLASSEVRFEMDYETKTPKGVKEEKHVDTHSMVEEFMLLANITVAKKILTEYPDCALLRRHPIPAADSYKPLIEAAKKRGFSISIENGKALAESLDRCVDPNNPKMNRLLRMMTTRCMTQALYFSAGTISEDQYCHFGLATPIYTHFTSPIRRYADLVVHRLLAAALGADDIGVGLLSQHNVAQLALNMNYRHRNAQYAGRASTQLTTLAHFRQHDEVCAGYIMAVRENGMQVFVEQYGIEAIIVLKSDAAQVDMETRSVRSGDAALNELDKVTVRVYLNETVQQRPRIAMDLVEPRIPGISVEFDGSTWRENPDPPV